MCPLNKYKAKTISGNNLAYEAKREKGALILKCLCACKMIDSSLLL